MGVDKPFREQWWLHLDLNYAHSYIPSSKNHTTPIYQNFQKWEITSTSNINIWLIMCCRWRYTSTNLHYPPRFCKLLRNIWMLLHLLVLLWNKFNSKIFYILPCFTIVYSLFMMKIELKKLALDSKICIFQVESSHLRKCQ